jgi:hypothetical protein
VQVKSVVIITLYMVAKNNALFYTFIPSGGIKYVATFFLNKICIFVDSSDKLQNMYSASL